MSTGRVAVDGFIEGIGFAVGPNLIVTARHVIQRALDNSDKQMLGREVLFLAPSGSAHKAIIRTCNRRLDVASLDLVTPVATWLEPAEPVEGGPWRIDSRPRDDDPMLSGSITSCARPLMTESGDEALLLQLHVEQSLGDYSGYSGSPVRFAAGSSGGDLVGILIEQARWRKKEATQHLPPVANVLYGVPIGAALLLLGIKVTAPPDPNLDDFRKRMEKLKTIEPEVDPELFRDIGKEVVRRYVFGEW